MDLFSLNGRLSPHEDNASTSGGRTEWPTNKRCHDFICQLRHYAQTTRCGGQFAEKEITTRASIWQANIRFSIPMSLSCSLSLCAIDDDGWSLCWDGYYVHCHCLDFFSRIVNLFLVPPTMIHIHIRCVIADANWNSITDRIHSYVNSFHFSLYIATERTVMFITITACYCQPLSVFMWNA